MTRPEPKDPTWGILRSWGVVLLVGIAISGIWWVPPLVQSWRTPPISDGFGIGDAVVALRLDAGGTSYLVLVDAEGRTRSAQLAERGSGESRVVWTEAGLSTGDPGHEYLLRSDGLTRLALPGPGSSRASGNGSRSTAASRCGLAPPRGSSWPSSTRAPGG
ncbi:hypothetical protein AB3K78_08105 [Leucobacter sp. HNU]|uniref:hypothetical protein n=1 Tax=Leucobacter sp. HNU TaxID=3236805 RepID=UPI003A8040DA